MNVVLVQLLSDGVFARSLKGYLIEAYLEPIRYHIEMRSGSTTKPRHLVTTFRWSLTILWMAFHVLHTLAFTRLNSLFWVWRVPTTMTLHYRLPDYINDITSLETQLRTIRLKLEDQEITDVLIYSLSPEYGLMEGVDWHAHVNVTIGGYITIYRKKTSKTSMRSLITHVSFLAIVIWVITI